MSWESAFNHHMLDLTLSEEDVEALRSERSIKQTKITSEEIEKLVVDENLNPAERVIYILSYGQDIQKLHALQNLTEIIKSDVQSRDDLFELVDSQLVSTSNDVVFAALKCLCCIVKEKLITGIVFAQIFMDKILENFNGKKDKDLVDAWFELLDESLGVIPKTYFKNQLLLFVQCNSSLTHCVITREICCKLTARLSKYLPGDMYCSQVVPTMKLLCQDIDLDIRSCMCLELEYIILNLQKNDVRDVVLPELNLLFEDEEVSVRQSAITTLCKVIPRLEKDKLISSSVTGIVHQFYKKSATKNIPEEMCSCARHIGKINHFLSGYFTKEEKSFLLFSYKTLCTYGSEKDNADSLYFTKSQTRDMLHSTFIQDKSTETRFWCAYNFPAMLLSIPPSSFKTSLNSSFESLTKDTHAAVRKCIASSFHEIAKILGKENVHLLGDATKRLLKDSDFEVLNSFIDNFAITLECLGSCSEFQGNLSEFLQPILNCETYLSTSLRWRIHETLLEQLCSIHSYLPSEQIGAKLIPLFFKILNSNKVLPVRTTAGRLILRYIKHNRNVDERREMCARIIAELAHSTSCKSRLLYLSLCQHVPEFFSKAFFKEYFYEATIGMAFDSIVNVRIKFCKTLPLLKSQLRLPVDRLLLQMLEQTVRRIMALENDRDVSSTIREVILELDQIPLSVDGGATSLEDVLDHEKEIDEESIVEESYLRENETIGKGSIEKHMPNRSRNGSLIKEKKVMSKSSKTNSVATKRLVSRSKESCQTKSGSPTTSSSSGSRLPTAKKRNQKQGSSFQQVGGLVTRNSFAFCL